MKLFRFGSRPKQNNNQIPHLRVPVAHLQGPGKLHCQAQHLVFATADTKQVRLDIEGLESLFLYGAVSVTGDALHLLSQQRIALAVLNASGTQVRSRLLPEHSSRSLQRLLQYHAYVDATWALSFARGLVVDKLEATLAALRHYQRQGKRIDKAAITRVEQTLPTACTARQLDQLRGLEGQAAAAWFGQYGKCFGKRWTFAGRQRRPARDPINALLSLAYMQLYRRVAARLEASGYEATWGGLHEFRPGRLSLACDIMEPLRIPVVDRWVVAVCQQGMVQPHQFTQDDQQGVRLAPDALTSILARFEQWWHSGNFDLHLGQQISRYETSLREQTSASARRQMKAIKNRFLAELRGSGELEVVL